MNKKYGKLENDKIVYAPNVLIDGERQTFTNDANVYLKYGWKEIVPSSCPDDGKEYTLAFEETATQILVSWTEAEAET